MSRLGPLLGGILGSDVCRSFILAFVMLGALGSPWDPSARASESAELCQGFAEKLGEISVLGNQPFEKHIEGNAYFEEANPKANSKHREALNLDTRILNQISNMIPAFGVTVDVTAKLEEARRTYSQRIDAYAQYTQGMSQADMAYRIGNTSTADRLLDRANSFLEVSNEYDDRAFTLLEQAGQVLCETPESAGTQAPLTTTASSDESAVAPEDKAGGVDQECPECPAEESGPPESTAQGIEFATPIVGLSTVLFDEVTDCESGESIDLAELGLQFVFRAGATPPYDLTDLEKVIVKAPGYVDKEISNFTPVQLSFGFFQVTVLTPDEADICLYKKPPCCRCLKRLPPESKVHARLYTATKLNPSEEGEFGTFYKVKKGPLIGEVQLSKSRAGSTPESITIPTVPHKTGSWGEVILEVTGASLACDTCRKGSRTVPCIVDKDSVRYDFTITKGAGWFAAILGSSGNKVLVQFESKWVELEVTVTWDCVLEGCETAKCSQKYALRLASGGEKCSCGGVGAKITVTKLDPKTGEPVPNSTSSAVFNPRLGSLGKDTLDVHLKWNSSWKPGDTLVVRIGNISATCWCTAEKYCTPYYRTNGPAPAQIKLGTTSKTRSNLTLVKNSAQWRSAAIVLWYEFKVTLATDAATKGAKQCFTVNYKCKKPAKSNCKSLIDPMCKQEFCIVFDKPS